MVMSSKRELESNNDYEGVWSFWGGFINRQFNYWEQSIDLYKAFSQKMVPLLAFPSKNVQTAAQKWATLPYELLVYLLDTSQRTLLFWDILRKRGNNYLTHMKMGTPPALEFDYTLLIDGRTLKRPVNYSLVQIRPPKGVKINPKKRPFLIIDPRAGHVAGIGGFKESSQVGVGLADGHAVYFVIFYPNPVPNQRLSDVTEAEIFFLKEIIKRHPHAPKPCVVGNCQGGWAAMCMAALCDGLTGPIILNGAPLSYWAGEDGKNPMRYLGGLSGGRWVALFLSDLGNGLFDGANLVANFEYLNPANTFFTKYYQLYSKVDSEEERFLKFERWWGGYSLMNKNEIDTILDDLFIGNKLSNGRIISDSGQVIDLRTVREPIFVFCSEGDNISPPHQSLQWIKDIHKDERSIKAAGQTIIYMVHQSIGHLGIFVSGQITQREYKEITHALETFEALPPGLYEMLIQPSPDGQKEKYTLSISERCMSDLLPGFHPENDEKKFSLVKMISDFNALGYTLFLSPAICRLSTKWSGEAMRQSHYLRWSRYSLSDNNLFLLSLKPWATFIRLHRWRVNDNNSFLTLERLYSAVIQYLFDSYRDQRDHRVECLFHTLYGTLELMNVHPTQTANANQLKPKTPLPKGALQTGDFYDVLLRVMLLLCRLKGDFKREEIDTLIKEVRRFYAHRKGITQAIMRRKLQEQSTFIAGEPDGLIIKNLKKLIGDKTSKAELIHFIESTHLLEDANVKKLWGKIKSAL